jgi:hypothetical protein
MNATWHQSHVMPPRATLAQRIAWHRQHQKHCACRPIPAKLAAQMESGSKSKSTAKSTAAAAADPAFARVVKAFAGVSGVTYGGKGFGQTALKLDGKIFAMLSSRGQFVVKVSKARADELVREGRASYFDPGRGRLMKEWVVASGPPRSWTALAQEAHRLARGGRAR